jgi:heterodisulfide reductase subunit A-like polyferredoxin
VDGTQLGLARVAQFNSVASRVNPTCDDKPGHYVRKVVDNAKSDASIIVSPSNGFDEDYDVIVVGYGFAGATAALEAARAGARVLLIEKTSVPGGISICSYGSVRCARDFTDAFDYLFHTNGGRTSGDVMLALA